MFRVPTLGPDVSTHYAEMGNLLSLNPKIHRFKINAKILCRFSYCQWILFWVTSDAAIGLNEHALVHGRPPHC